MIATALLNAGEIQIDSADDVTAADQHQPGSNGQRAK